MGHDVKTNISIKNMLIVFTAIFIVFYLQKAVH